MNADETPEPNATQNIVDIVKQDTQDTIVADTLKNMPENQNNNTTVSPEN